MQDSKSKVIEPITPGNGPQPLMPNGKRAKKAGVLVMLGTNALSASRLPFVFVTYKNEPIIGLAHTNAGLMFYATIFNVKGDAICKIVQNRILPNDDEVFYFVKQPHRLFVYNKQDRLVLDLEHVNKWSFRLKGDFYARDGLHVVINDEELIQGGLKYSKNVWFNVPWELTKVW